MSEIIDNRQHRIRTLKEIIQSLHRGAAPHTVKARLREIVQQTDAGEIAAMEEQLIADGMSIDEVRSMCDLHAEVTREILIGRADSGVAPGHPVDIFRQENHALRERVGELRALLRQVQQARSGGDTLERALLRWRELGNELMDVEKHYQRKENVLFPKLEAHGITGPSKVMWAKDDEARKALRQMLGALAAGKTLAPAEAAALAAGTGAAALDAVEGMIEKEEHVLLPMALDTLTEEEWAEVWRESPRYGWCLVEPRTGYRPTEPAPAPAPALPGTAAAALAFPTGTLTYDQLTALLQTLPVDLTFVDADDCVRYFSEGPDRVFPRSTAILGRMVQHCHPPASVHVVEKILADFRSGQRDVAEFWIEFHGRFVHIRYFAVRAPDKTYLGTLEVTQDITRPRALMGERRLLQYD